MTAPLGTRQRYLEALEAERARREKVAPKGPTGYWENVAPRAGRTPKRVKDTTVIAWLPKAFRMEQVFMTCEHGLIWWEGYEIPCPPCFTALTGEEPTFTKMHGDKRIRYRR